MKTRNAMQLKALINNRAKAANVSPQLMLQNYMLERLIDRISRSAHRDSFIVKGGMLIGSLIGVERRTTKDLDVTVLGFDLVPEMIERAFGDFCSISVDDNLEFELIRTEDIRETDDYPGIRVHMKANYDSLSVPLAVDVTAGDKIVPGAIVYDYPFVFDEGAARIMAYPLETVLAEKVETILSRNVATTRSRDFYDVYELWHMRREQIDPESLGASLAATCSKRHSISAIVKRDALLSEMQENDGLLNRWDGYVSKHAYARGIGFGETLDSVREVADVACANGFAESCS